MTGPEQERRDREADALMRGLIERRGLTPEAAYEEAKSIIDDRYRVSRLRWGETA